MRVTITECGLEELDKIVPLFDAYRQFYGASGDLEEARGFLRKRLGRRDSVILLAQSLSGEMVGFTQLYPSFSSVRMVRLWILNDLFVTPGARGQGIGRSLMIEARRLAEAAEVSILALATQNHNSTAKALYEDLGYTLDAEFDHYELDLRRP